MILLIESVVVLWGVTLSLASEGFRNFLLHVHVQPPVLSSRCFRQSGKRCVRLRASCIRIVCISWSFGRLLASGVIIWGVDMTQRSTKLRPIKCRECRQKFNRWCKTTKFCSRSCQTRYLGKKGLNGHRPKTGKFFKCLACGKEFYVQKNRAKTAKFCSRSCLAKIHLADYIKIYGFQPRKEPARQYRVINIDGKQVREHRYLMEQFLGRRLDRNEHVHHINGNGLDNRLENLVVVTNSEHQTIEYEELRLAWHHRPMAAGWPANRR